MCCGVLCCGVVPIEPDEAIRVELYDEWDRNESLSGIRVKTALCYYNVAVLASVYVLGAHACV